MSLLTPPHSSHKENGAKNSLSLSVDVDAPKTASTSSASPSSAARSVVWSPHNSYHSLTAPAKPPPTAATTNAWVRDRPVRSILKKRRVPPLADSTNSPRSTSPADVSGFQNLPEDLDTIFRAREATPEPSDPLCDLNYLAYPVSLILKENAQPRELIEGYSVLAARLRTTVQFKTDADASWPLFQPLRKQANAFVDCVVRDLGRAFIDPTKTSACPSSEQEEDEMKEWEERAGGLPSPQSSPVAPKKKGMTASQVKYARDLCTICHAAIKLLCIMFSVPATFSVFEDLKLKSMLTAALAIPMVDSLPTPNARKTCALVILLLQCQRLPESVTLPARDRIALALKRGICGQLGKEGKKGSANDGLKAIHDLSIYQPKVFVPAFTSGVFLRSILQNLLAPTLILRVQACHALGGIAYALAALPASSLHATVSDTVVAFITTPAPPTPSKNGKLSAPTLPPRDSSIVRTLRTTMSTSDATHIAQSSVWAITVIASLVVLVGSRMYTDRKACQTLMNVLKLGAKSKKASIRHLFGLAWRSLIWAWFQPDYDTLEDVGEEEKSDDEDGSRQSQQRQRDEMKAKTREAYFQLLQDVVDMHTGLPTFLALLSCPAPSTVDSNSEDALRRALSILQAMANSTHGDTINDAALSLMNLLTPGSSSPGGSDKSRSFALPIHRFLPRGLFSSHPTSGILAADLSITNNTAGGVMHAIRPIFDTLPHLDEVRALTRDELRLDWVWSKLAKVWRTIVGNLEMTDNAELPDEVSKIWESLVVCGLGEDGDDTSEECVERVIDVIIGLLEDKVLDFTIKDDVIVTGGSPSKVPFPTGNTATDAAESTQGSGRLTKHELKIEVVKALCATVKAVLSKEQLSGKPMSKLFACLTSSKNVAEWTAPRSRSSGLVASRKRQRTSSLSPRSGLALGGASSDGGVVGPEVIAPITCWASLVASMLSVVEGDAGMGYMKAFWGLGGNDEDVNVVASWVGDVKSEIWGTLVNVWKENEGCWEGCVALLAAPFLRGQKDDGATWTLTTDETNVWKELYEYASGKALDYGMDSACVVDGVAEIVLESMESAITSSRPSSGSLALTSSSGFIDSLITISDLLLDHLDITEARDLPSAVVTLVSKTLRLSYPLSSRNTPPATWIAQALTRLIEKCPATFVRSLIEGLCDSLAIWLADEAEVWTESVLDYTFCPMYTTILLCMQSLPKDLEFLETIAPLLDSVFSGRTMPAQVLARFKSDFKESWDMSPYGKMEEPAGGWSNSIKHCLGLEEQELAVSATPTLLASPVFDEGPLGPLAASPDIVPATPKRSVNRSKLGGDAIPRTPMAAMNGSAHIPSPHRPHKDSLDSRVPFPLPMYSPVSPVRRRRRTSSSTSGTAGSSSSGGGLNLGLFRSSGLMRMGMEVLSPGRGVGSGESPTKRRRVDSEDGVMVDKENTSPLRRGRASVNASPVRMTVGRVPAPLFEVIGVTERITAAGVSEKEQSQQGDVEKGDGKKRRRKMKDKMGGKKQKRDVSPAESVASSGSSASTRSAGSNDSSDDERWIASALVPFPSLESGSKEADGDEDIEMTKVVKKRKRTLMESVMIPSRPKVAPRQRKLEHALSFDSALPPPSASASTGSTSAFVLSPPPSIAGEWKTPTTGKRCLSGPETIERAMRKRKRSLSVTFLVPPAGASAIETDDPFEMEVSTTTPLPALRLSGITRPAPLEDSSSDLTEDQDEAEYATSDVPSSDDDPRYGQVTPHHIVSPPLIQRTGNVYVSNLKRSSSDGDLGVSFKEVAGSDDDDSMNVEPGSSPSKKVAERRMLQRQNSLSSEGVQRVGQLAAVFRC